MEIKCTNCGYEGEAKMAAEPVTNTLFWLSIVATVIAFIVAFNTLWPWVLLFIWLVLGVLTAHVTRRPICPQCGWVHVVRLAAPSSPSRTASTKQP